MNVLRAVRVLQQLSVRLRRGWWARPAVSLLAVVLVHATSVASASDGSGDEGVALTRWSGGETVRCPLPGHVLQALAGATPVVGLGAAREDEPITLTIVLARDDEEGFQRFLRDVYDPASPRFRQYLTAAEQADAFGPSRASYTDVLHYLEGYGFTLVEDSANRLTMVVEGTRAGAESAFGVHIGDYEVGGRLIRANDRDPWLPAALALHVSTIAGMSNAARPRPQQFFEFVGIVLVIALIIGLMNFDKIVAAVQDNWNKFWAFYHSYDSTSRPSPLAQIPIPWKDGDGTGQKIGLVEFDTYADQDVKDYLALAGHPAARFGNLSKVNVGGGAVPGAFQAEVLVDVDTVLTYAPGAQVVVYEAPFSAFDFQAVFNAMIGGGVNVISNSWAYCEDQTTLAAVQGIDTVLASAQGAGISVFNAAGDTGATCLDGTSGAVAVPASSPNATAVGGSSITPGPLNVWNGETWWNGTSHAPPTGQGGYGVSRFFPRPSYQNGLTTAAGRSVPDVVMNADPAQGVMICQASAGGCPDGRLWAGTSFAAPTWAALAAILNQTGGVSYGTFNVHIYPFANTSAFHAAAELGSDFAHVGLGSPNTNRLHLALTGGTAGAVDAAESSLARDAVGLADGTSPTYLVAHLRDADGNLVSGKTVSLMASGGSHAVISPPSAITTIANGAAVFSITDTVVESVTFTAHDDTDNTTIAQTSTIRFEGPPAASGGIGSNPGSVPADGVATSTITVTLQDAHGAGAVGKVVTLSQGSGRSKIVGPTPAVTGSNGVVTFTVSDVYTESVTYTATDVTDGGLPVPGSASVGFTAGAGTACSIGQVTPAAGYAVTSVATNFTLSNNCVGVSGTAWDPQGNLYAMDYGDGNLYRFPASVSGALANAGTRVSTSPIPLNHCPHGLAFSKDGTHLYLAQQWCGAGGDVVEISTTDGHIIRNVAPASSIACATGIATDPLTGDLFVTTPCGSTNLYRISDPDSQTPGAPTAYSPSGHALGINFTPDGTIWTESYDAGPASIVKLTGTNTGSPGTVTALTSAPSNAGGVLPLFNSASPGSPSALLVSNGTTGPTGSVQLVDLTQMPPTKTTIASGGTGQILLNAGPDGCAYLSNADRIDRITAADGSCSFAPSAAGPSIGLSPSVVSPNPAQGIGQATFTAALHNVASPEGTPVFFGVVGASLARFQMVRADSTGKATFTYSGLSAGRDTVLASASIGGVTIASQPSVVTWVAGKDVTSTNPSLSPSSAIAGASTPLIATLTDLSQYPVQPISGASIHLSIGAQSCDGVTNASGVATCSIKPASAGSFTLTASYAGDGSHVGSSASKGLRVLGTGLRGDEDGSGVRNVTDVLYLINHLFAGGPAPGTACRGDANADGNLNVSDVLYLINYLFAGGPFPPPC